MKRWLLCLALCAWLPAAAAELTQAVQARLIQAPVLRGEFEQSKQLAGFKNALISRGDFLLSRTHGMLWDTRVPFASRLVLTPQRLVSRSADGAVLAQLDGSREPAVGAVNEVVLALLAGDLPVLAARFEVEGTLLGSDGWRLNLRPREAGLAQLFSHIELEGDSFVRRVRLDEAAGDVTEIRFSGLSAAQALTSDDAQRFR